MIDCHCHILPGIDDGSPDLATSLEMARQAVADGVDTIVATPHFRPPVVFEEQLQRREEAYRLLVEALKKESVPLRLLLGAECQSNGHLFQEDFRKYPGMLMPVSAGNQPVALVELSLDMDISHAGDLFFQAQLQEFRLILAHPERYPGFHGAVNDLKSLMDKGAYLQFNQDDIRTGFFHRKMTRPILELMAYSPEQVLLASDSHEPKYRPCKLTDAKEAIVSALGEPFWKKLTVENPAALFL